MIDKFVVSSSLVIDLLLKFGDRLDVVLQSLESPEQCSLYSFSLFISSFGLGVLLEWEQ